MEVQKRKWSVQKKGQKSDKLITKKGSFMDYHIKVQSSLPSPGIYPSYSDAHNSHKAWSPKKQKSDNKLDLTAKKGTYLEQI